MIVKNCRIEPPFPLTAEDIRSAEGVYQVDSEFSGDARYIVLTAGCAMGQVLCYTPGAPALTHCNANEDMWVNSRFRRVDATVCFEVRVISPPK